MASTSTSTTATASLPSFSASFADIDSHPGPAASSSAAARKRRRHAESEVEVKTEHDERDELEPSPPPPDAPTTSTTATATNGKSKRRRLSLSRTAGGRASPSPEQQQAQQAASTLESLRASSKTESSSTKPSTVTTRLAVATSASQIASPVSIASSVGDGPTSFPTITGFATRRRQSQNSAGADKAARLSIRPPPSPYGQHESNVALPGARALLGVRGGGSLVPAIHSAPPPGWAQRHHDQSEAQSKDSTAGPSPNPPHTGMRLPVVPPVPGMSTTPRTAIPSFARRDRPAPLFSSSPLPPLGASNSGYGRLTAPRTAGLPSMGPPAPPTAGLSNFRTTMSGNTGGQGYVQPIATARPSFGGNATMDREKAAFLAPFEQFYDSLVDAKRLKGWLADQLRTQQQQQQTTGALEARLKTMERDMDAMRRRLFEMEGGSGSRGEADGEDVVMSTSAPHGSRTPQPRSPPTTSTHPSTSAARYEPPHRPMPPAHERSSAPEPSPMPLPLPTPLPPKTPGVLSPPTLHAPARLVGARISSPRAPTHSPDPSSGSNGNGNGGKKSGGGSNAAR